jgi:hypothetical protein
MSHSRCEFSIMTEKDNHGQKRVDDVAGIDQSL